MIYVSLPSYSGKPCRVSMLMLSIPCKLNPFPTMPTPPPLEYDTPNCGVNPPVPCGRINPKLNPAFPSLVPSSPSIFSMPPATSAAFNSFMLFKFTLTGSGCSGSVSVPFIISVKWFVSDTTVRFSSFIPTRSRTSHALTFSLK